MRRNYVLAVDGGNTKTLALVATLDGQIRGYGRAGCGDIYHISPGEQARAHEPAALLEIERAVETALRRAEVHPTDLEAAIFNMAGADWPEDFTLLESAMRTRGYGQRLLIQNDALGVLHAACMGSTTNSGVSIICGTGAATGARGPDGRTWHSSHWQDSVQGASHLGQQVLTAVLHAELGISPPTTLRERVLAYFGASNVEEVLHRLSARLPQETRPLGGLAAALLDEAEAGDSVARHLVSKHGSALGDFANVAARRVGLEGQPFPLVLAGGVLRHPSPLLAEAITARVHSRSPQAQPIRPRFEPVIGVLFSALELAGQRIDEQLISRLPPTLPPASFFDTLG
ncbi:N-acetylglucosamine kinase [Thermogemmatispora carboxidivorans]|uniref:N-acetylglucosamine kinase n=1 Tax=Thermogemmatispora carboxidivorans TaxID=1382306 RepID=UPI00069AAC41|nr:BadF/BadG/BcrA/BcrD ATPase family protein [Thermogemmatispora carboxidivorans]